MLNDEKQFNSKDVHITLCEMIRRYSRKKISWHAWIGEAYGAVSREALQIGLDIVAYYEQCHPLPHIVQQYVTWQCHVVLPVELLG